MSLPRPGEMAQRKHLPSVTEILCAAHLGVELNIPDGKLAYVLERGTALHSAIELDIAGELDEGQVPGMAGTGGVAEGQAVSVGREQVRGA